MKCCGNLDYLRKTIFIPLYLYRTACLPLHDRSTAIRQPGTIAKTSLYCDHVEILDTSYGIPLLSEYPNYRRNMVVVFVCNTWLSSAAKRRRFGRIVSCRPVTYWSGRRLIFLLVDRYKRPLFCCR